MMQKDYKKYDGYIYGMPQNENGVSQGLWLVNWHYAANWGTYMAYAKTEIEALRYSQYDLDAEDLKWGKLKYQVTRVYRDSKLPKLFNYGDEKGDWGRI